MRDTIFICYSHKDNSWREVFEKNLQIGVVQGKYEIWSDQHIAPSEIWEEKINSTLSRCRVAILLVSHDFFKSDYIIGKEIVKILALHRAQGLGIFWVRIHNVNNELLKMSHLLDIQSASRLVNKPLADLSVNELDEEVGEICASVIKHLGVIADTPLDIESKLRIEFAAKLSEEKIELSKAIDKGDCSIVYDATWQGTPVAVKVMFPSMRRQWLIDGFVKRAKTVQMARSQSLIGIKTVWNDGMHACVAMEKMDPAQSIRLSTKGPLSTKEVAYTL